MKRVMKSLTYVMNDNKTMHQRCKQMKNVIIKKIKYLFMLIKKNRRKRPFKDVENLKQLSSPSKSTDVTLFFFQRLK